MSQQIISQDPGLPDSSRLVPADELLDEGMFRMLAESVADGIMVVDGQGRICYWNAAVARIFGYAKDEILGSEMTRLMTPEVGQAHARVMELLRRGEQPTLPPASSRVIGVRKDGSRMHLELSLSYWNTGKQGFCAAIIRDITTRKRSEDELLCAKEQAEAANRIKSEFLANMSHEVRTPLNGIIGMLQLLQETPMSTEQREYVDTALLSGHSLLRVINDILDLSKIEADKIEIEHKPFRIREIMDMAQMLFARQARRAGLTFSLDMPQEDAIFLGDAGRIRQVFLNLVGNALKFTESGSISVRAQVREAQGKPSQVVLAFSVEDTGIGIPPDQVVRLFEPFTQLDGSYTRKYQGTGLGLTIAKRLVTRMGGDISVESEPGQGTIFCFTVVVGACTDALEAYCEHRGPASQRSLRILVAEDERINQTMIRRLLELEGHSVRNVENGEQALAALGEEHFDCVLMDVQMPVLDGLEAVRRIRAGLSVPDADIPVIALTAHALKGDRELFLQAGMSDYLAKPVDRESVRAALARAV